MMAQRSVAPGSVMDLSSSDGEEREEETEGWYMAAVVGNEGESSPEEEESSAEEAGSDREEAGSDREEEGSGTGDEGGGPEDEGSSPEEEGSGGPEEKAVSIPGEAGHHKGTMAKGEQEEVKIGSDADEPLKGEENTEEADQRLNTEAPVWFYSHQRLTTGQLSLAWAVGIRGRIR